MVGAPSKSRLVGGSFFAVVIGCLAALVILEVVYVFTSIRGRDNTSWIVLLALPLWWSIAIWLFALPVWLIALLPLSLFLPYSSVLWRWPVCTVCGAIAGAIVVALVFPFLGQGIPPEIWFFYSLGAVVGGVTCLAGSLIRKHIEHSRHLTNR